MRIIGREEIYRPIIGRRRKYEISNDNTIILISFSPAMGLMVTSTRFKHKRINEGLPLT